MKKKHTLLYSLVVIATIIIGVLSFSGRKEPTIVANRVARNKTTKKTTTKATIPAEQEVEITYDECSNIYTTLLNNSSSYSLENIKNCGYENVYDKNNITKVFTGTNYIVEPLNKTLDTRLSSIIHLSIDNNTTNIEFELDDENVKIEKIAGVTDTYYDLNTYSNEVNIFFFTNNGVFRLYIDNYNSIKKYTFDKVSSKTTYTGMAVHRLGTDNKENVYFYIDKNNKYTNVSTNTTEKYINNIFYEDNNIKINKDRTLYVNGHLKPYKANLYMVDPNGIIINVVDADNYLYGYVHDDKENVDKFQKIENSRVSEVLYNKTKLIMNKYNRMTSIDNENPNYIIVFRNKTIKVLEYKISIPLLNE